ncbi:TonB-dependent receptor [uncultured Sphingomonas sp.]|uniref:TonB-dependent receptor n=1 Tax=uncultured Sphingomonas sp. TaxID=158754 RepID=UPI0035C958D8
MNVSNRGMLLASVAGLMTMLPSGVMAQAAPDNIAPSASAAASTAPPSGPGDVGIADIIVTAQKRRQQINDVPVSITTATGQQLANAGVETVNDLAKIVPGLTYTASLAATPILTLRGVGFNEYTLGASPTVSVYVDQVPVPFLQMARGTTFDLERVEVLKGPQGILFGQNSTGGAINYIAATPTKRFQAGADASYGRFDEVNAGGYMSGPLTDTIGARLAVRTLQSGDWQRNYTRASTLGSQDLIEGRFTLDWKPSDRATITIGVDGWRDKSDTPGTQLTGFRLQVPTSPRAALILAQPIAPADARATNYGSNVALNRDDNYIQGSLRGSFKVNDAIAFTTITSYDHYKEDYGFDRDGTALRILDVDRSRGTISDFTHEMRLSGDTDRFNWVVGGNLFHAKVNSNNGIHVGDATNAVVVGIPFDVASDDFKETIDEYAAFGNAEYKIIPTVTVLGGVRYTDSNRKYAGCTTGDAGLSSALTILSTVLSGTPTAPIVPGQCVTLLQPSQKPVLFRSTLGQDNVSWRGGINFEPNRRTLVYANVTKGYKSGSYPTLSASTSAQLQPVTQESILAYEAGFKLSLADRRVQLNGAAFYYDYRNKQVRGNVLDPVFQVIERLVNVPKSRIQGAEVQLVVVPMQGLTLNASATYLDATIRDYTGLSSATRLLTDFRGARIPFTPKWQAMADAEYRFPLAGLEAYIGSNVSYNSSTTSEIGAPAYAFIRDFVTLDLRAGIGPKDGPWTVSVYGRNVTNAYYWNNAFATQDVTVRYAAKPVTYGLRLAYKYR